MRIIAIATLCALIAIPAQAQKVERIKARGANAAGVCAGSLDMLGQYLSRANTPNSARIREVEQGRDFFAEMPRFPNDEIASAATAFVSLMSNRILRATTDIERQSIQRELVKVATGCLASAKSELRAFNQSAPNAAPANGLPVPSTTLAPPVQTQPLAQPYETQPLVLDPIVPAQ